MEGRPILINEPAGSAPKRPVQDFVLGWSLLLWLGWLFALVGILNLILLWVPVQLGSPEYEFASVASSFDSLPLPSMGLILALAASRARGLVLSGRLAVGLAIVLALAVLIGTVLYWLNVPLALKAVLEPLPRLGIRKSIIKVSAQGILYPIMLGASVWMATRRSEMKKQGSQ
jgi:hypothetical protein